MNKILIVDDEKNQRELLSYILQKESYNTLTSATAEEALKILQNEEIDVLITDLKLPKMDGIQLLKEATQISPETSVVIITGHGSIDSAVYAIKHGAFDYITKPLKKEQVVLVTRKAIERTNLLKERKFLVSRISSKEAFEGMIGEHPSFKNVIKLILKIAPLDATVLITGESGTGKEMVARAIHNISPRKNNPFIPVNCAALPENLIESELFGYLPGAFTGAMGRKKGIFEAASGGTIFLDEISEVPLQTQVKLLRFLQNKEIYPLGSTNPIHVDVRIISASNVDLEGRIKDGKFRADLFYRLNIFSIKLPALRERSSDIPILANYFLDKYKHLAHVDNKFFTSGAIKLLLDYNWPGNIRELESVVQKAVILSDNEVIDEHVISSIIQTTFIPPPNVDDREIKITKERKSLDEIERDLIIDAMNKTGWNMSKASKILGITYRTLQYRLGKYGIKKPNDIP
ncbi:MAG: sigma-54 dependent transcriptional regulator [Proteobacteria bacterium]|nr:sigma-54 dependent transcriptional regulator [Pseudomonadota bacterium]